LWRQKVCHPALEAVAVRLLPALEAVAVRLLPALEAVAVRLPAPGAGAAAVGHQSLCHQSLKSPLLS